MLLQLRAMSPSQKTCLRKLALVDGDIGDATQSKPRQSSGSHLCIRSSGRVRPLLWPTLGTLRDLGCAGQGRYLAGNRRSRDDPVVPVILTHLSQSNGMAAFEVGEVRHVEFGIFGSVVLKGQLSNCRQLFRQEFERLDRQVKFSVASKCQRKRPCGSNLRAPIH